MTAQNGQFNIYFYYKDEIKLQSNYLKREKKERKDEHSTERERGERLWPYDIQNDISSKKDSCSGMDDKTIFKGHQCYWR